MELSDLTGVGEKRLKALRAAGITSLRDLLQTFPRDYRDLTRVTPLDALAEGEETAVEGRARGKAKLARFRGMTCVSLVLCEGDARLTCVWFNQPWMRDTLDRRAEEGPLLLYGRPVRGKSGLTMNGPTLETERRLLPRYAPVAGVPGKVFRELIAQAMERLDECLPETLPSSLRLRHALCERNYAVRQLHFPENADALRIARRRVLFERLLLYQAALRSFRASARVGVVVPATASGERAFWARLPFSPTAAQSRVLSEIAGDLAAPRPMARLVQGDVGSGKTAVAFGAMKLCADAGFQSALMAPTEILARQHFENARRVLGGMGVTCGLLVGGMKAAQRREALAAIASGAWQAVFGTHALIVGDVKYKNLGLVVTDEQHRFGVGQRTRMLHKGAETDGAPETNMLVMSATPIPRSLALILYGDLDVSVIDELPPGRTPVKTRIVPEEKREDMYAFVRQEVARGRQAYVVCPLVEESEAMSELTAATAHYARLSEGELRGVRMGLLHGQQPARDKEAALAAFQAGDLQVLVATTVVEVGVDVPNATVMVVEDAARYGLSQLHQLRGRVGRGAGESWCFLVGAPTPRLRALAGTNDGFEIARKDLLLRGPGDLLGTRQHGQALIGSVVGEGADMAVLSEANACLREICDDPHLAFEKEVVFGFARVERERMEGAVSFS